MTNFLLIYVGTESDAAETASVNIYNIVKNLVDTQVFSRAEDRFVVYLEDLYRTRHNVAEKIEEHLTLALSMIGIQRFDIYANSVTDKIIQHCLPTYPQIANHLEFALNFARAIIAPTLVKELFQQFGLHYETFVTRNTTVYHDLDMRCIIPPESSSNDLSTFSLLYEDIGIPLLAKMDEYGSNFDVFWAINPFQTDESKKTLFLDAFYETLTKIIQHSWAKPTPSAVIPADSSTIKTNPAPSNHKLKQFDFYANIHSADTTKAIIGLHVGYGRVQNALSEQHRFVNLCRFGFCPPTVFGLPPYNICPPYGNKYPPRASISGSLFMPAYATVNQKSRSYDVPYFACADRSQLPDNWSGTVYIANSELNGYYWPTADKPHLKKTIYGKWQQIPILKKEDILEIIRQYRFMAYVFILTQGLRRFAEMNSADIRQARITHNTRDDAWVWLLSCKECNRNFLPTIDKVVSGFTFCSNCLAVFCNTCKPQLPMTNPQSTGAVSLVCEKCLKFTPSLPAF